MRIAVPPRRRPVPARSHAGCLFVLALLAAGAYDTCHAQASRLSKILDPCCEVADVPAVAWGGMDNRMTIEAFAAYCAPILWFSPDEPLLDDRTGKDIRIPEPFPFEDTPDAPVVYYRIRRVLARGDASGPAFVADPEVRGRSILDLANLAAVELDYFFYYSAEEGFGGHMHDVESVEMKIAIGGRDCEHCRYGFAIQRVVAKAHGVQWYDNTLETDIYTVLPLTLLVEEGKHADCTDKNGDGYFTPGYDVNRRVNDAWGVRDIIRSGALFTGGYQSWMTKVRRPEMRVFPPLPADSPLRRWHSVDGIYAPDNAIYELRPFPSAAQAEADPSLVPFIADKGDPNWPEIDKLDDLAQFRSWVSAESFVKSYSLAFRYDGEAGISLAFPLFVVKNFEEPLSGGWLVNRIYFEGQGLRDFGWSVLYTPSASRWVDGYFCMGWEWNRDEDVDNSGFLVETGMRFRADLAHSKFRFMRKLGTDFWGARFGLRNIGAWQVERIGYVFEIGNGVW